MRAATAPWISSVPTARARVSVEYVDNKPKRIEAVVISTQHSPDIAHRRTASAEVKKHIIDAVVPANMVDSQTKYHINPTGRFVVGGPHGDTGLTGRKIIVDTYGGMGRHGGGAFSRQGSDEGGPLGLLHGALHRQEPRGRRAGQPRRSPARLRHRRGRAGFGNGEYVRHRQDRRREVHGPGARELPAHAARPSSTR